jgi:hypothetical protein
MTASGLTTTIVPTVSQIAAPSPKVTGGINYAPYGTALPTDPTTALDPAFISLGRVEQNGIERTEDRPEGKQYDWGGDLIAILQDHYGFQLKFRLLQQVNPQVQKTAHGTSNVTVVPPTSTVGTMITTNINAKLLDTGSWVVDAYYQQMNARLVIPYGRPTSVQGPKWSHKELALFDITLEAFPDNNGNFAIEIWNDGIHT